MTDPATVPLPKPLNSPPRSTTPVREHLRKTVPYIREAGVAAHNAAHALAPGPRRTRIEQLGDQLAQAEEWASRIQFEMQLERAAGSRNGG